MRLRFHREENLGDVRYRCESDQSNAHGVSLLACLLMDDGGLPRESSVEWIEKGLEMTERVESGVIPGFDWARETWGADINAHEVTVYSHHDASWREPIPLASFRKALASWREFLVAGTQSPEECREIIL